MNLKISIFTGLICLLTFSSPVCIDARKTGYRLKTSSQTHSGKKEGASAVISETRPDSTSFSKLLPSSGISTADLDKVVFTGFDKKRNNSKESFFIINNSSSDITGVCIELVYQTPDRRMLNKRYAQIRIHIPPGETRKVDIPTWDTQHSFYYFKSESDPSRGNPFSVVITPLAIAHDIVKANDGE